MRLSRFVGLLAVLAPAAVWLGCGTPGAVQLPSLNLARPAQDLSASRKGDKVTLDWTLPRKNTDRTLVQLKHLGNTLICRQPGTTPMGSCQAVGSVTPPKGPERKKDEPERTIRLQFTDTLPPQLGQQNPAGFVMYAVEIMNDKNRSAGLSNQVAIAVAPTIAPPPEVRATVTADGVRVSWSEADVPAAPRGLSYRDRIERRPANSGGYLALGDVDAASQCSYLDEGFEWETNYEYRITSVTVVNTNGHEAAVEGADSAAAEIFTRDIYPPAQPGGLQAVYSSVGQKPFIDLTWAPNMERDLAGYNVFRSSDHGQSYQKLNSQLVTVPSFRDQDVQPGIMYGYRVSAVDLRGNESARSEPTSEEAPAQH
jgi:hypothetical protein